MERMTREQMVAEFGEPGVQNPAIIDLIAWDPASERVVLAMVERRPWGSHILQLQQIEEKINRYLGYVLDGHMEQHYPQYVGKTVCIRLDCVDTPTGEAERFVAAAAHAVQNEGVEFAVSVVGPRADA